MFAVGDTVTKRTHLQARRDDLKSRWLEIVATQNSMVEIKNSPDI
jgi:hypothetical protein